MFSAHDETGDDLRRRWDDPDLSVVDRRHPVVFAGAGSHSGAYLSGDYLITVEPPTLGGLVTAVRWVSRVLAPWSSSARGGVGIPYVDYARGDGRVLGAGGERWDAVVIDESTGWVRGYRGLWGLDTGDRLGGERGPAGPRYERDGSVRACWADPVGWAGLAKVAPSPVVEQELIDARTTQIDTQLADLEGQISAGRRELGLAAAGLAPGAPEVRALAGKERAVTELKLEATKLRDEKARLAGERAGRGGATDPHAHLSRRNLPLDPATGVRGRLLSWWAVLSTPLVLYAVGAVIHPAVGVSATATAVAWIVLLLAVEAGVRGHFLGFLLRLAVVVASAVGLYFLWADWRVVASWGFFAAALIVLLASIREALRR